MTTTVVPPGAKAQRNAASGFAWRWQPPERRVPSSFSVWYAEPSEMWTGMPWKPIAPMSVFSHRIISGSLALPFQALDSSERLYTSCVPGCSLPYLLPDTSQERITWSFSSTAHTRWPRRSYTTRLPEPELGGRGGASSPTDDTDDSGKPHESVAPAGGAGVRITNDCSSGQTPIDIAVSRPTIPSTNRSRSVCNRSTAAYVAESYVPVTTTFV